MANNIKSVIDTAVAGKVDKAGDTMLGALTLSGAPTLDLHAATKKYVDDNSGGGGSVAWGDITGTIADQTDLQAALDAKVSSSGGSISGALIADEFKTTKGYLHTETIVAPAANFAVHAEVSLGGSPTTITTGFTQPDFARTIRHTINQTDFPSSGNIVTTGTARNGAPLVDTIDSASQNETVAAFKTITQIDYPAAANVGDAFTPSVTNNFGLSKIAFKIAEGVTHVDRLVLANNTSSDVYNQTADGATDILLAYFTQDTT